MRPSLRRRNFNSLKIILIDYLINKEKQYKSDIVFLNNKNNKQLTLDYVFAGQNDGQQGIAQCAHNSPELLLNGKILAAALSRCPRPNGPAAQEVHAQRDGKLKNILFNFFVVYKIVINNLFRYWNSGSSGDNSMNRISSVRVQCTVMKWTDQIFVQRLCVIYHCYHHENVKCISFCVHMLKRLR